MKNETTLVIGSSGTVGAEVLRLLTDKGLKVRATTSKQPKNTNTVHLNLATGEGIKAAFEGVERAFIMSPAGYVDHYAVLSPLIQEAKRRGLKKVVLMTAMGANADETSGLRRAEVELEKSGLSYNIVRPNWFLQNFNTFWIQGIKEQGKILLPAGKAKTSFIDAGDISAVVAELLTSDKYTNKAFDLTGPESLDHDEVAKEISAATGKTIVYQEIQPSEMRKGLLGAGLPADYTEFLLTILGFLREGYGSAITHSVKEVLGREPKSLKEYARVNKQAWA